MPYQTEDYALFILNCLMIILAAMFETLVLVTQWSWYATIFFLEDG
jgi:hypothetical protein